jgi:HEPN domain-containing protein
MTVQDLRTLVQYWSSGSDYDWKTAQALFKTKKYPYCLFMVHLSIEKILKALIAKETKDHAPFTHNLVFLAGRLAIDFPKERIALLEEMNDFNLEARYPDEQRAFYKKATKPFTQHYLKEASELRKWLINQL